MSAKRIIDSYVEVYLFAKSYGKERAMNKFDCSKSVIDNALNIGEDFQKYYNSNNGTPNNLDGFTPRQLMEELVKRGYKGTLTYTQQINLEKI